MSVGACRDALKHPGRTNARRIYQGIHLWQLDLRRDAWEVVPSCLLGSKTFSEENVDVLKRAGIWRDPVRHVLSKPTIGNGGFCTLPRGVATRHLLGQTTAQQSQYIVPSIALGD